MALSLLGYFFCMITVLTTAVVVMVGLFNVSTSEGLRHHPHAVAEHNVAAAKPRLFMVVPETKSRPPANDTEASSTVVPTEKADTKRSKPHKPKMIARRPNNFEGRGYGNAQGYAQGTLYGPQRLFSNW